MNPLRLLMGWATQPSLRMVNNARTESGGMVSVSHTLSVAIETAEILDHHSAGSCNRSRAGAVVGSGRN